ncbi:MAG TPA: hypothetical protein VHG91_17745 [Longimicrobium sp.]|nr:hypothetical protein [Longimicrobium sp.]
MSTPFDGSWIGERDIVIDVTSQGEFLKLQYAGGGEGQPLSGFAGELGGPVIYAQFRGNTPHTGVLTGDHDRVLWSNDTVWRRIKK